MAEFSIYLNLLLFIQLLERISSPNLLFQRIEQLYLYLNLLKRYYFCYKIFVSYFTFLMLTIGDSFVYYINLHSNVLLILDKGQCCSILYNVF